MLRTRGRTVTTMNVNEIRQRLEHELRSTGSRLREQGGLLDPRQMTEVTPTEEPHGDPFDRIKAAESRELYLLSRDRLAERLERIEEALQRLRDGSNGMYAGIRAAIEPGSPPARP